MEGPPDIKNIIAENLVLYRRSAKLTQREVAEKFNYSDKAVSKWERAESMPDVATLKLLADFYGITIDDLTTPKTQKTARAKINKLLTRHKLIIPFLSAGLVWLIATAVFVALLISEAVGKPWLCFIYAIPVSVIVLVVFNNIWGRKILSMILVSVFIWSIPLTIVLSVHISRIYFLFIIPAPLQVLVVLWYLMRLKR